MLKRTRPIIISSSVHCLASNHFSVCERSIWGLLVQLEMSTKVVDVTTRIARPTANFHASVWGDYFLKYTSTVDSKDNEAGNKVHGELRDRFRKKLASQYSLSEKIDLIDSIQRLGVSYHFENEIDQVIQYMHMNLDDDDDLDLYNCSLRFRLLRQHGYNVSAVGTFKKFLDNEGEFKTSIENDIKGMLSMHEATHLRLPGEDILEKAFNFTTKEFEKMLLHDPHQINPRIIQQITSALSQSLHKGMRRIEARNYFSVYEDYNTHDNKLLEFAKLNFNILQRMYQRELGELTGWWKNLDFTNKCPFARDRLVEGYLCTLAVYFEPEYAYSRKMATKLIAFSSILDDIYDAYGTWEELVFFTDTINRWEKNDLNQLPEYIRYYNDALHNYFEVLEIECTQRNIQHGLEYMKQMVKVMANIYLKEACWLHKRYIPSLEEYMSVTLISSTARFLSINFFTGMDPVLATKDVFDWAFEDPPIFKAIAIIMRLIDDIVGFKFDMEREHVTSAVQCYMNQHGVPEEIAIYELKKQVIEAWKLINSELIQPTKVPRDLLTRVVGIARFMEVLYNEEDGYTHSQHKGKKILTYVLVNPVDV